MHCAIMLIAIGIPGMVHTGAPAAAPTRNFIAGSGYISEINLKLEASLNSKSIRRVVIYLQTFSLCAKLFIERWICCFPNIGHTATPKV